MHETDVIDAEAEGEEIVVRYTNGPTASMSAVASFILGHLQSRDAEFSVIVRKRKPTEAINEKLVAALRAVEAWRNGPEGPEILFKEGAKMIAGVREAIKAAVE